MSAAGQKQATKGSRMTWVGPLYPAAGGPGIDHQVRGASPPTLPAAHWVRFVRSPVAAGQLAKISRSRRRDGASPPPIFKGVKKITPMLHKFNYKPVGQPIFADGVVRFVGEPVAAVVAAERRRTPRTLPI